MDVHTCFYRETAFTRAGPERRLGEKPECHVCACVCVSEKNVTGVTDSCGIKWRLHSLSCTGGQCGHSNSRTGT